jgi:hypothetical protein
MSAHLQERINFFIGQTKLAKNHQTIFGPQFTLPLALMASSRGPASAALAHSEMQKASESVRGERVKSVAPVLRG